MIADRVKHVIEQSAGNEMEGFLRKTVDIHQAIDALTAELQGLNYSHREEIVRRAEEAGAALARLEWALQRASDDL